MIVKTTRKNLRNHIHDLRDIDIIGFDNTIFKEKLYNFLLEHNVKISFADENLKSYKDPCKATMTKMIKVMFSDIFTGEENIYFRFENKDDAVMFKLKFL